MSVVCVFVASAAFLRNHQTSRELDSMFPKNPALVVPATICRIL